jgi:hypothetical protein
MARQQNKTIRLIFVTVVLLFMLVVLPLGSWYYLQNGLDYRISTMSELKQYGLLPDLSYRTLDGKNLTTADLRGKVTVTNVLDWHNPTLADAYGTYLQRLHEQFNERADVYFLIHTPDTTKARAFAQQYGLQDSTQCFFLSGTPTEIAALPTNYHLSADALKTHFTLIDTKTMVRKHYDVRDEQQVKRLVEHLALLIPLQKKEEITLKRDLKK